MECGEELDVEVKKRRAQVPAVIQILHFSASSISSYKLFAWASSSAEFCLTLSLSPSSSLVISLMLSLSLLLSPHSMPSLMLSLMLSLMPSLMLSLMLSLMPSLMPR